MCVWMDDRCMCVWLYACMSMYEWMMNVCVCMCVCIKGWMDVVRMYVWLMCGTPLIICFLRARSSGSNNKCPSRPAWVFSQLWTKTASSSDILLESPSQSTMTCAALRRRGKTPDITKHDTKQGNDGSMNDCVCVTMSRKTYDKGKEMAALNTK